MIEDELQIGLFGTFDLENYGDLLFPLLAERELGRRLGRVRLRRFSFRRKTTADWPYDVTSLSELPAIAPSLDGVLVGGGHLVRFDKSVANGYVPPAPEVHLPTGYWLAPALVGIQQGIPVAWNAVGVHGQVPAWAEPLMRVAVGHSDYVAVRDEAARTALARFSMAAPVEVVPDTAFGVGRLVESAEASAGLAHLRATLGLTGPYLVLQSTGEIAPIARLLRGHPRAFERHQLVCVPVGPVLGDDDAEVALELPGALRLPRWPRPEVLAALIAGADGVIGHSLHLAITAVACGVPVFRPAARGEEKYGVLAPFDSVHTVTDSTSPEGFAARLGRAEPSAAARAATVRLDAHWDRVAAVFAEGRSRRGPPPALTTFWQSLAGVLETRADEVEGLRRRLATPEGAAGGRARSPLRALFRRLRGRDRREAPP